MTTSSQTMATNAQTDLISNRSRAAVPPKEEESRAHPREVAQSTDGHLLDDYLDSRDKNALAALVERHGPMVWGVCRRVLASHQDAEDAFQVTFLVLVRKAASIVPREQVGNWLHGVALQTALKARATVNTRKGRERAMSDEREPAAAQSGSISGAGPKTLTAEWIAHWNEVRAVLDDEVRRLPDNYRAAVIHCDLKGETRKIAARNLGVPEGTVAGWLARARTLLANRLAARGITPLTAGMLVAMLTQNAANAADAASAALPPLLVSKTIQAANSFSVGLAAGQAASAGAIPLPIAALTEGVMKTMMLSKVRSALTAGLYLGFLTIGAILAVSYPAEAQDEKKAGAYRLTPAAAGQDNDRLNQGKWDMDRLQGTWKLVTSEYDGLRYSEGREEVKDDLLVIEKSQFNRTFSVRNLLGAAEPNRCTAAFELDTAQSPRVIVLRWKKSLSDKEDFTQRAIYELKGDTLKMCLNFGENEKDAPTDFSAETGTKRFLWTFRKPRASDQKGGGNPNAIQFVPASK